MARQADDSFVSFGAKPDKGFWTWNLAVTGSGRGREKRVGWTKELKDRGSRHRTPERWDQSEEMGSRPVKEDRVKMSRHSSCFVEVSLVIHASVSLYMLSEMQCYITPCLALWVNPKHIVRFVRLFFLLSSRSLDCIFDVAVEKCALPLSEPLVDHRPRRGMVRRGWCNSWERRGNVTVVLFNP